MVNVSEDIELEQLLNDEPQCESEHNSEDPLDPSTLCSVKVVARKFSACGASFNICDVSRLWNLAQIRESRVVPWYCDECGNLIHECWKIVNI